jgi:hypothetical protein
MPNSPSLLSDEELHAVYFAWGTRESHIDLMMRVAVAQEAKCRAAQERNERRCPCEFLDVRPCSPVCSCRTSDGSAPCKRCIRGDSPARQLAIAQHLVGLGAAQERETRAAERRVWEAARLFIEQTVRFDIPLADAIIRDTVRTERDRRYPPLPEPPTDQLKARPRVVCLCGSTRFMDAFFEQGWRLTLEGVIVLSVGVVKTAGADGHAAEALGQDVADRLDELHLRKIDLADSVLVLNVGGYIGSSTRKEIAYATATGKPVEYLAPLPEPEQKS